MIETNDLKATGEFLERMRRIPGFEPLDDERLKEVLACCSLRKYAPGEIIIREGHADAWVFYLVQGKIRISAKGNELGTLRRLGDVFGEMSVIDGSPRSATALVMEETLVLALDVSRLDGLGNDTLIVFLALMYRAFAEKLAKRLRLMNDEIARLRKKLEHHGLSAD